MNRGRIASCLSAFVLAVILLAAAGCGQGVDPAARELMSAIAGKLSADQVASSEQAASPAAITFSEQDTKVQPVLVHAADPAWGGPEAPVTIVVFSDFECPFCSRHANNVRQLKEKYGVLVRVVFKQFPLAFHKHARSAAMASLAAQEQGKFWEMHDKLFERTRIAQAEMRDWATDAGIDLDKVLDAVRSGRLEERVNADMAEGESVGVRGTPNSFVNGVRISGAVPVEELEKQIKLGLMRAYVLLRQGVPTAQLYGTLVGAKK